MSLRIYHTSDLHDHRGIVKRLRALRDAAPGFLFDSGDSLRGSQTVYRREEPIMAELAAAAYDAQGVGNREFHYLHALMSARARKMRYPLVCSNLLDMRQRPLPFVRELTLEQSDSIETWWLRVFSLLVPQYREGSRWERVFGWRFLDPIETARRFAESTPAGTVLIVLSHLGLAADRRLAEAVPRLNLVLGGHSHDTLSAPEYVGSVPIVHAGPYGAYVSRSQLERLPNGTIVLERFALLPLLASA